MGRASRGKWERRESQGQRPEGCTCDAVYGGGWAGGVEYLIPSPGCPVHVAPLGLEFKQQGEGYGTVSMTPKPLIGRALWDGYAKQWMVDDLVTEQAKGAEVVHPWDAQLDYRDEEYGGLTTADVPEMMWCEGCGLLISKSNVNLGSDCVASHFTGWMGKSCGPVVEP